MKAFALVLLLGCAAHPAGPAWPTLHATHDAGESLAPHRYNPVAAAAATEEDEAIPVVAPVVAVVPAGVPLAPIAPIAKPVVPDEPVLPEEVIEIEE